MISTEVIVKCPLGLHLREAARVVEAAQTLKSTVTLCKGCIYAEGCSILDLLLLEATEGTKLELRVDGEDEKVGIEKIMRIFEEPMTEEDQKKV